MHLDRLSVPDIQPIGSSNSDRVLIRPPPDFVEVAVRAHSVPLPISCR